MFKSSETIVSAAVVTSGTVTFSYPSNTSAGSFAAYGHKVWIDKSQNWYYAPADISVSFGASDITLTYSQSTTIPAGARLNLHLNLEGDDSGVSPNEINESDVKRSSLLSLTKVALGAPDAADADGICESQTINTTASLDGALVSNSVATFDVPRNIVAAWTTTATITITGTDEYGNTIVETSASGTSHAGTKAFKTVTGIESSTSISSATVGTGDVLGLPFYIGGADEVVQELEGGALLSRKPGKAYVEGLMLEAAVDAGTSYNVVSPVAGSISKLSTISQGAITTGGDITVEVNTTAVDGLAVTVADSAVEGDVDSDTPTDGHSTTTVAVGDRIEIIPASAFNASADIYFILEIDVSAAGQLDGTLVAGVSAAATATTGDVRGTYDPAVACDGSTSFDLIVNSPDPKYKGVAQYSG